jgi:hypothetical protein
MWFVLLGSGSVAVLLSSANISKGLVGARLKLSTDLNLLSRKMPW